LDKISLSQPWKLWFTRSIPDKNILNSHWETMFYMLLLLTQMVFFRKIHVFLQLSWIGLFGSQEACHNLQKPTFQEVVLSKTNWTQTGKHVLHTAASFIHGFCWRDACTSSTELNRTFWKNETFSPLKTDLQEVFLSKTTSVWKITLC
jgi:hypothetical protein